MTSVLFALTASILWGMGDFLGGLASRRATVLRVVLVAQLAGLVPLVPSALLVGASDVLASDLYWGVAAGFVAAGGLILLYSALAAGSMSVVAPITAVCAIALPVPFALSIGEQPGPTALAGVALAALAVALIGQEREEPAALPVPPRRRAKALMLALAAGVAFAALYICLKYIQSGAGLWPLVLARGVAVVFLAAMVLHRPVPSLPRNALLLTVGAGLVDALANVFALLALQVGLLSVVAALTSLYPASTVLLARVVLGERLRMVQVLGVGLAAVAVVLIAG